MVTIYIEILIYIYIYISYMWSLPCYIKGFTTFSMSVKSKQWFSVVNFLTKMKKGLYQEMFENKSLPQEKFLPKISRKKYLPNILKSFPPTDSKEKLAQKKISEEKSLPNTVNFNRNLYHKVFDNLISTKNIEGEISTK